MNLKIKKVLRGLSTLLVVIAVALVVLLYGVQLFGFKPYSVLSGSMESVYPTGSLIYVKDVDPAELEVKDIITFKMANGKIATHRIVELVPDEEDPDVIRFRTKGDENEIVDGSLVSFGSVIGQPKFCIPFLGYFATYMMQPSGKYVVIAAVAALTLLEVLVGLITDNREKKKADNEQN